MLGSMLTSKFLLFPRQKPGYVSIYANCVCVLVSLQYENRKVEYFDAIWNVLNWKTAEKRFEA
jgi:hypothetical protein